MRISEISFINDPKTLFSFSGCIGRLEYFILAVTTDVIYIALFYIFFDYFGSIQKDIIENGINLTTILLCIVALVLAIIKFAAITKRIHDIGKKGVWAFAACIASRNLLIDIVLLVFLSLKKGKNEITNDKVEGDVDKAKDSQISYETIVVNDNNVSLEIEHNEHISNKNSLISKLKRNYKTVGAIVISCLIVFTVLPKVTYQYFNNKSRAFDKRINIEVECNRIDGNLFSKIQEYYPIAPQGYYRKKDFEMYDRIMRWMETHPYGSKPPKEEYNVYYDRFLDKYLEENWKAKGFVQKIEQSNGYQNFIDDPIKISSKYQNSYRPRISKELKYVKNNPIILYLDFSKIKMFPSSFYKDENTIYFVMSNGDIYSVPKKLQHDLYSIQKDRENATEIAEFLERHFR